MSCAACSRRCSRRPVRGSRPLRISARCFPDVATVGCAGSLRRRPGMPRRGGCRRCCWPSMPGTGRQRFILAHLGDPEAIVVLDETAELLEKLRPVSPSAPLPGRPGSSPSTGGHPRPAPRPRTRRRSSAAAASHPATNPPRTPPAFTRSSAPHATASRAQRTATASAIQRSQTFRHQSEHLVELEATTRHAPHLPAPAPHLSHPTSSQTGTPDHAATSDGGHEKLPGDGQIAARWRP